MLGDSTIFLTGFMGAGKTTIGQSLAEILEMPFYDLDIMVEQEKGIMVVDIFMTEGEYAFRESEAKFLEALLSEPGPNVIALGGGTLANEANRAQIRNRGILIGLKAEPHQIIQRLNEGQLATLMMMTNRPIYDSLFMENIISAVDELYEKRKIFYEDLDITITSGGKTVEEVIEEILVILSNKLIN
jgi:shikimate kinase